MWAGEPWRYHAHLASAMNLRLLDPREAVDAAMAAFFWDGQTDMACLRDAIGQTLRLGYARHIQRLMVTELYTLLLGVRPTEVHAWYLSVYVDAVESAELANTLGMSQYADGGVMASKPYVATGRFIDRMSNHCRGCRYGPAQATGPRACPNTTLYWDFLARHESALAGNPRMTPAAAQSATAIARATRRDRRRRCRAPPQRRCAPRGTLRALRTAHQRYHRRSPARAGMPPFPRRHAWTA